MFPTVNFIIPDLKICKIARLFLRDSFSLQRIEEIYFSQNPILRFICSENIKSILRRRNLDVKFVVECLALNENCRIIPILILEQDLICADFVGKILEQVAPVGIMKNLALKQETNKSKRPS